MGNLVNGILEQLGTFGTLIIMYFLVFFIILLVLPLMVIIEMSKKKGRNTFSWFILALFISPFICIFLLHFLGETEERAEERIIEEEKLRNRYRNPITLEKWLKENPEKTVNDYYNNR